jgi:hypothetical protein
MLYILVLDGPSARMAKPVVATRDPKIVRLVTDAIVARLHSSEINLVKREVSNGDPLRAGGTNKDI